MVSSHASLLPQKTRDKTGPGGKEGRAHEQGDITLFALGYPKGDRFSNTNEGKREKKEKEGEKAEVRGGGPRTIKEG